MNVRTLSWQKSCHVTFNIGRHNLAIKGDDVRSRRSRSMTLTLPSTIVGISTEHGDTRLVDVSIFNETTSMSSICTEKKGATKDVKSIFTRPEDNHLLFLLVVPYGFLVLWANLCQCFMHLSKSKSITTTTTRWRLLFHRIGWWFTSYKIKRWNSNGLFSWK